MNRLVPLVLVLLGALGACGGHASLDAAGDQSADGGGTDDDAGSTCDKETSAAEAAMSKAQASLGAGPQTCQVDSDCVCLGAPSCVGTGCGCTVVNQATASALGVVINQIDSEICVSNCPIAEIPCALPVAGPACANGICQNILPAAWTALEVLQMSGADAGTPPGWSCNDVPGCTQWTVTPDGTIQRQGATTSVASTLSTSDLATVDTILRSVDFRLGPPECDAPTNATSDTSFEIRRGGGATSFDGTGCLTSGPSGNAAAALYAVVKSY